MWLLAFWYCVGMMTTADAPIADIACGCGFTFTMPEMAGDWADHQCPASPTRS